MLEGWAKIGGGMPEPRTLRGVERLPTSLSADALFARFMRALDAEECRDLIDAAGNRLLIDRRLFQDLKGNWKTMKGERAAWLLYTAINIEAPDEIWLDPGRRGGADKLHYLSRFAVGRWGSLSCIAVFERAQGACGAWSGRTNYATLRDDGYLEGKRAGELIYWRREQ